MRERVLRFAPRRRGKAGRAQPRTDSSDRRNETAESSFGSRRIAQQIALLFGVEIDKDVVRRVLAKRCRPTGRGTIANVLSEHGINPAPDRGKRTSWSTFLKAHCDSTAATDFFTVDVLTLPGLVTYYIPFVIDLASRTMKIAGTSRPHEVWMMRMARDLTDAEEPFLRHKRFLIMDRNTKYSAAFRAALALERIEPIRLPPRSPNSNACAERFGYLDQQMVQVSVARIDADFLLLGERASSEIKQAAKERTPFFLSVHFTAPHWPWEGADDEAVARTLTESRHYGGGDLKTFAAMTQSMDTNIGRILATLEDSGAAENTIVIFTSDNGGERFSDTWPFVGAKGELLEGGIRVPAIVRWPKAIAAGGAPSPEFPSDGICCRSSGVSRCR